MSEQWRSFTTLKIHSLFDTEFKKAQVAFDWVTAAEDIRVYTKTEEELPVAFSREMRRWIVSSKLNSFRGLEAFPVSEVTFGCSQFIDDFHILTQGRRPRYSEVDYQYYWRISKEPPCFLESAPLASGDAVILSCPFTFEGDLYPNFKQLLDQCQELQIPVFLDAAWVGTCREIDMDFSHPAIHSVGFSLSKGLGVGDQRVGLRLTRNKLEEGPIWLLNEHQYLPYVNMQLGMHMMQKFSVDHLQLKYGKIYQDVCRELKLQPTKCIQLAHGDMQNWASFDRTQTSRPIVGVAKLLRAIYEDRWK